LKAARAPLFMAMQGVDTVTFPFSRASLTRARVCVRARQVTKGAELHRDGFKLFKRGALFDDGSSFDCDAIVACTGYRNSFPPFLDPETLRCTVRV